MRPIAPLAFINIFELVGSLARVKLAPVNRPGVASCALLEKTCVDKQTLAESASEIDWRENYAIKITGPKLLSGLIAARFLRELQLLLRSLQKFGGAVRSARGAGAYANANADIAQHR
jgi:hypothetical protein